MNNIIQFPVVAGVEIAIDSEGRFNLNSLYRASEAGRAKEPNRWLRSKKTIELIQALKGRMKRRAPKMAHATEPVSVASGIGASTYVTKELAIAYAAWISPEFHLQVIDVFLAYKAGELEQRDKPLSTMQILELAMESEKKRLRLEHENKLMLPKADGFDRIAEAEGSMCITDAAKHLQVPPRAFTRWLSMHRWIYKRPGNSNWISYQDKIQHGYMEHKVHVGKDREGNERVYEQARILPRGLTKLAMDVALPKVA